ncbi:MAG: rRNA maturation RNase YbeY [Candidatus Auribacterota bacterium]|jgi:probable rRNA maturation factor|nr:rRNA maturation RNase YbeY [Candidatus Auribacterota bacterium]
MDIRINNRQKRFKIHRKPIKELCVAVLSGEDQPDHCELDITIVSDAEIAELNKQYLSHDGPTDVISFPQDDEPSDEIYLLGDVVVSADRAHERSADFAVNLNQEFGLYLIHGILHLLGFDDQTEQDKIIMENRQSFWFNKLLSKSDFMFLSLNL